MSVSSVPSAAQESGRTSFLGREDIVMAQGAQRRTCRRFEVPGAKGRYKRVGLLVALKGFSKPCCVTDISKGGLAFACEGKFGDDEEIIAQLLAPNEAPLNLRAEVRWQGQPEGSAHKIIGVQFASFGRGRCKNSRAALDVLKRLEAKYGKEGKED